MRPGGSKESKAAVPVLVLVLRLGLGIVAAVALVFFWSGSLPMIAVYHLVEAINVVVFGVLASTYSGLAKLFYSSIQTLYNVLVPDVVVLLVSSVILLL